MTGFHKSPSIATSSYVTWPKPPNNISKQLNRNDNENKVYTLAQLICYLSDGEWPVTQRNAIRRYHVRPELKTRRLSSATSPRDSV